MNKKVDEKKEKHYKGLGVLQTLMTPCARVQYQTKLALGLIRIYELISPCSILQHFSSETST